MAQGERNLRMDALRVFAAFSVVLLHAAARSWDKHGLDFGAVVFFDAAVRYSVPVFVMLSGMFLLDPEREIPPQKLFRGHVLRLLPLLVFWALAYASLDSVFLPFLRGEGLSWKPLFRISILGDYHLWYLLMIIGLYLATPILRLIAANRRVMWYYLALWALFGVCGRMLSTLPGCSALGTLLTGRAHLNFFYGYTGYFLLGYALHTADLAAERERLLRLLWPVGFLCIAIATLLASWRTGKHAERYMSNFSVFVLLEAVGVFVSFDRSPSLGRLAQRPFFARAVRALVPLTLGIYLVHPAVLSLCTRFFLEGPAFLLVPVHFAAALVISAAGVFCVKKVPLLRKLM